MLAKSLFVMGGSICASNKSLFALKPTESKCFSLIFHKFILVSVVRNLVGGLFVLLLIPLLSPADVVMVNYFFQMKLL